MIIRYLSHTQVDTWIHNNSNNNSTNHHMRYDSNTEKKRKEIYVFVTYLDSTSLCFPRNAADILEVETEEIRSFLA